jgi:hypothetical protein
MENSADRFKRIAEYRVRNILNGLRILGNCANRNAYSYTDSQIEKIFNTINEQISNIHSKFTVPKKDIDFKL